MPPVARGILRAARLLALVLTTFGCQPPAVVTPDGDSPITDPTAGRLRSGFHLPGLTGAATEYGEDLAVAPGGVVVGGVFAQAGELRTAPALWDGSAWNTLPAGHAGHVAVAADGTIYGLSEYIGCLECAPNVLARLDDGAWVDASPPFEGVVEELAATGVGVIVVGTLTTPDPSSIARLDPTGWTSLGVTDRATHDSITLAVAEHGGVVCIGGLFDQVDSTTAANVACLADGTWSAAGGGLAGEVRSLAFTGDGRLVAGGQFTAVGGDGIAILTDGVWTAVSGGVRGDGAAVDAVAIDGADIVVGGTFSVPGANLARFHEGGWVAPAGGLARATGVVSVSDIVVGADGTYVAGRFDVAGNASASRITRWTASGLEPLITPGDVALGIAGEVRALVLDTSGLIVGGRFIAAGGLIATNVARLRGAQWESMGNPEQTINVLVRRADASLVAGGDDGSLLAWTGSEWSSLAPSLDGGILAVLEFDGALIVAGDMSGPSPFVVRWDGSAYTALGDGLPFPVRALAIDGEGHVCAGLDLGADADPRLPSSLPLWCWNGTEWAPDATLKGTLVSSITRVAGGSLLVSGALWFGEQSAFVATQSGGWAPLVLPTGSFIARATVVAALEYGALIAASEDEIVFWDGRTSFQTILRAEPRSRSWARVLLATSSTLYVAGKGAWFAGEGEPLAAGLAMWDY